MIEQKDKTKKLDLLDILVFIFKKLRKFGEIIFIIGISSLIEAVHKDLSNWVHILAVFLVLLGLELIINREVEQSEDLMKSYIDNTKKYE